MVEMAIRFSAVDGSTETYDELASLGLMIGAAIGVETK
jgi:hypothetical protein